MCRLLLLKLTVRTKLDFKRMMSKFFLVLLLSLPYFTGSAKVLDDSCTFKGKPLHGKVKIVEHYPDFKVKVVTSYPDLKVKIKDNYPDKCGEWKIVDSYPDFKVQVVNSYPDFKIKLVERYPGVK